jgi:hypothetical protein
LQWQNRWIRYRPDTIGPCNRFPASVLPGFRHLSSLGNLSPALFIDGIVQVGKLGDLHRVFVK